MIVATAIVSIGVFICGLRLFGVLRVAARALVTAQEAVTTLRNKSLEDKIRENKLQHTALQLFGAQRDQDHVKDNVGDSQPIDQGL